MKERIFDSSKWNLGSPWIIGQMIVWGVVLIGSLITAFLIRYSSLDSSLLPTIAYGINAGALMVGGFISGRKAGQKGWYYGGFQGLLYALIVILIGFLAFDSSMVINPVLFAISAFGISAIGGILGVNTGD